MGVQIVICQAKICTKLLYLAVFRVRDGVDQRVVCAGSLGQNNRKGRDQRSDLGDITPGSHDADDGERSPRGQPGSHVHDGDLGDADLGRHLLLVGVAAKGSDVHLLSLGAQFLFVFEDGVDDEIVAAGNDHNGEDVVAESGGQDVGLVVHGLGNVIVGATAQTGNYYLGYIVKIIVIVLTFP